MVARLCRARYPTLATPGNGRGAAGASEADRSIRSRYAVYLPGHRKQYGFDNLDFDFDGRGERPALSTSRPPHPHFRDDTNPTLEGIPMQALEMRTVARRIVRFSRDHKTRLYYAACVVLLVVAAGLRFHDLSEKSVWYDEAVAADNSSGTLSEVVTKTRYRNSSPILYPLALWAVQKVDVSDFSIRVLPATASVLTVAALLFLLPRAGVSRWPRFCAALLATLSVAAIEHAQGAREYSIDALLATLMIAGLLWYLRHGRKALLCVSLFLAPLLQYGLVLFGVAVIGAAVVLPPPTLGASEWNSYLSRIPHWLRQRIALLLPAACFLAGCAISYLMTARYQWQLGVRGNYNYYCQDAYDAAGHLGCAARLTWRLLDYHLPPAVAILAVGAFALLLMASVKRRRSDAIATLALLAVGIAIFAAILTIYPFRVYRQNIYLGPVIFLAVGVSIHWMADSLAALTRRAWLAPALAAATAGAIALAGVGDIRQYRPYERDYNTKAVLAFLEENVEEGDMVFATSYAATSLKFYQDEDRIYHYGQIECWSAYAPCIREMADLLVSLPNAPNRIFLVYRSASILEELELLEERIIVERFARLGASRYVLEHRYAYNQFDVALIANAKEFKESLEAAARSDYEALVAGEPAVRADFDIYIDDNTLAYAKEPCARADTEASFFLHLYPVDVNDLPDYRKQHGFDNLGFRFNNYGIRSAEQCVARRELPDYAIASIRTGQFVGNEDGSYTHLWEGEIRFDE